MRITLMSLLLIACSCCPASSFESANDLLSGCERFLGAVRLQGSQFSLQTDDPTAHQCWGYVQAFQELSAITEEGPKSTITRACPPAASTGVQLVRVFVSYAQKNPERLHARAGLMVLDAFRAAFPCPKR